MGRRERSGYYAVTAAAFLAVAALGVRTAWAGNLDAFYLSSEASLQAGAISADARDGGAVWYNPAGLAELDGVRVDVSVNGYAIRFGGTADFDAPPGTDVTRLTSLDINVVPTALAVTKRFGAVGVGFGVFVPSQGTNVLRTQLRLEPVPGGDVTEFSYDTYLRYQDYHIGPALGFRVSERLKLGASFLVNYRNLVAMADTSLIHGPAGGGSQAVAAHQLLDSIQVGAEFVLGAQWQVAPGWSLGLVARTPAMRLYQLVQTLETNVSSSGGSSMSARELSGLDSTVLTPFRFHAALSRTFGDSRVALEGSLLLPFEDRDAGTQRRLTWNARAGLRTALSPTLSIGGGLFTDLSPLPKPERFGEARLNYYGATVALDVGTPYGVYGKDGEAFARPRTLLFGTSVALSYALGLGEVVRATFATNGAGEPTVRETPLDVVAHELYLHLGSTLAE